MSQYAWDKIQERYETGRYTMAELAEEYGFNESYGYRKKSEQGWEKGKTAETVDQKAAKKVLEEESDKAARLRKEYSKIVTNIRRETANELFNRRNADGEPTTDFNRLKQLKIATQIIRNCRKQDWELHEIQEVADRVEQEIDGNLDVKRLHELANMADPSEIDESELIKSAKSN